MAILDFLKNLIGKNKEEKKQTYSRPIGPPAPVQTERKPGYFEPVAGKVRIRDVVRELPSAAKNVAVDIAQDTARIGGSVSLELADRLGLPGAKEISAPIPESNHPLDVLQRVVFGNRPIESLSTRIGKLPERAKEFGIPEQISKPLAAPFILGTTALEFIPGGSSAKNAVKALKTATNEKAVLNILKGLKVPDDVARSAAPKLAKLKSEAAIKRELATLKQPPKAKITSKDVQFAQRDNVINNLSKLTSDDYLNKGQVDLDLFGEAQDILQKAERGKDSIDDIRRGAEILKLIQTNRRNVFAGFDDLTLKTLEQLKGRERVSRQFLLDQTNRPELKQAERDIIRRVLNDFPEQQIPVKDFANKVKTELLPLSRRSTAKEFGGDFVRYENITLPDELRGPVANYTEHIYESPIKTSAGRIHFADNASDSYFAHTRIEDLAAPIHEQSFYDIGFGKSKTPKTGGTRRVIEIQSDLFQKGGLERENKFRKPTPIEGTDNELVQVDQFGNTQIRKAGESQKMFEARQAELSKLEPYRNTWHERIIREEIKQAAKDGKTKLQFPTGETAMKIEGLGSRTRFYHINGSELAESQLKPGLEVVDARIDDAGFEMPGSSWIITDVLGDGKFKAVPSTGLKDALINKGVELDGEDLVFYAEHHFPDFLASSTETFDISGKLDTNNPIYRFYEKEVGKYLTNKFKAKRVKDPQGVEWWEVNITKDMAKAPVEAFGGFAGFEVDEEGNIKFDPAKASLGVLGLGIAKKPSLIRANLAEKNIQAQTQLIDRFAPIRDFVKGTKLMADKDPYVAARNFAGHFGKVQNRLDQLSQILRPARSKLNIVREYALLERYEELYSRGIKKLPGGIGIDEVRSKKLAIEAALGEEGLTEVKGTIEQLRGYTDGLLQEARDAGIISQAAYDAIRTKNQKYIPLQRLEYLADQADNLPRGSNSFDVPTQNLIKSIKGSEKEIVDPLEAIVRITYKTVNLIERNKVAQKMADLAKLPEFKDLVKPVKGAVPAGMDKISVFRNGIKEEYAVPKEVADVMKGLNRESADLITSWASKSSAALRAGATTLNIAFLLPNVFRDFQTATLVSKVGFTPLDWIRGLAAAVGRGETYRAYLESGAAFSGFFEKNKSLKKTVKSLTQGKLLKTAKTIINPLELIRIAGETLELAPRLGVFKRTLRKGGTATEAAFNAREATVDFSKSGTVMRVLNQWIPFLNARLQGTINTFKAIKQRPVSSIFKMSALVGLPVVATYINNTRNFPEIWRDIAQFEKENNFILIYGDAKDERGNPLQVVKIPKGDVGRIFGNPLENFLSFLDDEDTKAIDELVLQIFSDISPISFERNGKFSGNVALSGVLPPTVKGVAEYTTNKNFYTGRDIVPFNLQNASPEEQYLSTTSPVAVFLGGLLGMSPLKIENFVGTQFGGVGRQLLNPKEATTQVTGRFAGARGGELAQREAENIKKFLTEQTDEKIKLNREAEILHSELKQLPKDEANARARELKISNPKLYNALKNIVEEEKLGLTYNDRLIKQLNVENGARAKYIHEQLKQLPTAQLKNAYIKELRRKKVISNTVFEQLKELKLEEEKLLATIPQ